MAGTNNPDIFMIIFMILYYILSSLSISKISKDLKRGNHWLAWIPFVQFLLFCDLIEVSKWFCILLLIPYVNIIFIVTFIPIVWYCISREYGKGVFLSIVIGIFSFFGMAISALYFAYFCTPPGSLTTEVGKFEAKPIQTESHDYLTSEQRQEFNKILQKKV